MLTKDTRHLASEAKFYESYAKFLPSEGRYETWEESVDRVFIMHKTKYKNSLSDELLQEIRYAQSAYNEQLVLGAQRALQFGGDSLLKHEAKMYNCTSTHLNRPEFFGEYMYLLLCGSGVGFSIQKHHVEQLPEISKRSNHVLNYTVEDSIEGWAEAIDVLFSSYFVTGGKFPKYQGKKIYFDLSKIRPKGAPISGGFKAPGPEPLRKCLNLCEKLLDNVLEYSHHMRPIDAYDLAMYIADAVISGGVRRAATIALFSPDDEEMLSAKIGKWNIENPQRARSNNSVVLVRSETSKEDLYRIMAYVKKFGEPGFIFVENKEHTFNPCVEIGMYPVSAKGESGFQACNLTEINGSKCRTEEEFYRACRAASIIGTLQAGYTNFKYVTQATKDIVEREALLGVSITGWMNSPHILFNEAILKKGAEIVKETNKKVAKLIRINAAARTTCVKPSGNASVILRTANGIHGEHSEFYLRHIQMNKENEIAKLIAEKYPEMIEESVWSTSRTDFCVAFPFVSPETSKYKSDLIGVKQLEYVKLAQQVWVESGTNVDLCVDPTLRHNVSNTITVSDWDEVVEYVHENKKWFAGISFIPLTGDRDYAQAPNAAIYDEDTLVKKYKSGALFASGLICHGLDAFNKDLWLAISTAMGMGLDLSEPSHENVLKIDFVRRFKKFSENYFEGDLNRCAECLKDVYYLHKWEKIQKSLLKTDINWEIELAQADDVDIDTMAAQACSGPVGCEI